MPTARTPAHRGPIALLVDWVRRLGPEAVRFGIVGLSGVALQFVVFNVLRFAGPGSVGVLFARPVLALVMAIAAATVVTYLGNRYWTYAHRERGPVTRELPVFVLLNAIAIAIGAACLTFSQRVLGLNSPLADNISGNVIGLGLGTLFRFWTYRTFVFTDTQQPAISAENAIPPEDPATAPSDLR